MANNPAHPSDMSLRDFISAVGSAEEIHGGARAISRES
jgi:hypothetical protein